MSVQQGQLQNGVNGHGPSTKSDSSLLQSGAGARAVAGTGRVAPNDFAPGAADPRVNGNLNHDANGIPLANSRSWTEPPQPDGGVKKSRTFGVPQRMLTLVKKGPPGGLDNTPLPSAPQGYTVRFIFHYAANLAPGDFHNASSDPFLTATLKAANPKRHKADPDLIHRTPTDRRTTDPKWDDAWVVANVPASGFALKCRMYDEDYPDGDDRLGNVTLKVNRLYDGWKGIPPPGIEFGAKKRMISKRAFLLKGVIGLLKHNFDMTPRLCISVEILGRSDPPFAQMCTLGPTTWVRHFSPMIGRLAGTKVNTELENDHEQRKQEKQNQKYE